MKRSLTMLLTLVLLLSLAACGSKQDQAPSELPQDQQNQVDQDAPQDSTDAAKEDDAGTPDSERETEQPVEIQQPEPSDGEGEANEAPKDDAQEVPASQPEQPSTPASQPAEVPEETPEQPAGETSDADNGALALLNAAWSTYGEDEKFPAMGGDAAHAVDSAPGSFDIANVDSLSYQLTFPAEDADLIDAAASLVHMMNMNTFTCGAFHVTDAGNAAKLASDLRLAVQGKHWMCGFPDKLVILTADEYVISLYGNEELVNTFSDALQAANAELTIAYDEAIAA